jgi:hypothetical protein
VVAADGENVTGAAGFERGTQFRVTAVDLVSSHPAGGDTGVESVGDQVFRQRGFGGEPHFAGDTGLLAAVRVGGPRLRKVEGAVEECVPSGRGIGEIHRDLTVFDPACRPGVLALHPDGVHTLLEVAGFVDHKRGVGVAQVLDHVVAQVISQSILVEDRRGEQMLHRIRRPVAGVFGKCPAVLGRQLRYHPGQHLRCCAAGFDPREPRPDTHRQILELPLPPLRVYALTCGHRQFSCIPHKYNMITRWPPHVQPADQQYHRSRSPAGVLASRYRQR